MKYLPSIWPDVESVLENLSDQHRAEFAKVGFPSETFNLRLVRFMLQGQCYTLHFDNRPQAFIAVAKEGDGPATTWFGATPAVFERGADFFRASRAHLDFMVDVFGPLVACSASDRRGLDKWMRLLGFTLIGREAGWKLFQRS